MEASIQILVIRGHGIEVLVPIYESLSLVNRLQEIAQAQLMRDQKREEMRRVRLRPTTSLVTNLTVTHLIGVGLGNKLRQ